MINRDVVGEYDIKGYGKVIIYAGYIGGFFAFGPNDRFICAEDTSMETEKSMFKKLKPITENIPQLNVGGKK
ncbi:MAG: hypothetical protein WC511_04020 [Candidatus Pacearchaeota archaeon]